LRPMTVRQRQGQPTSRLRVLHRIIIAAMLAVTDASVHHDRCDALPVLLSTISAVPCEATTHGLKSPHVESADPFKGPGMFGCMNDGDDIWVTNACTGTFRCKNGRELKCGFSRNKIKTEMVCPCVDHPPPDPPQPPPPWPSAPLQSPGASALERNANGNASAPLDESSHAQCLHWCDKEKHGSICKCRSCEFLGVSRQTEGEPCKNEHLHQAAPAADSADEVTLDAKAASLAKARAALLAAETALAEAKAKASSPSPKSVQNRAAVHGSERVDHAPAHQAPSASKAASETAATADAHGHGGAHAHGGNAAESKKLAHEMPSPADRPLGAYR